MLYEIGVFSRKFMGRFRKFCKISVQFTAWAEIARYRFKLRDLPELIAASYKCDYTGVDTLWSDTRQSRIQRCQSKHDRQKVLVHDRRITRGTGNTIIHYTRMIAYYSIRRRSRAARSARVTRRRGGPHASYSTSPWCRLANAPFSTAPL